MHGYDYYVQYGCIETDHMNACAHAHVKLGVLLLETDYRPQGTELEND